MAVGEEEVERGEEEEGEREEAIERLGDWRLEIGGARRPPWFSNSELLIVNC
jgi:hypothetical protein